jgi:signal transduction histidine kinase/CheY-like chemotaxis protein
VIPDDLSPDDRAALLELAELLWDVRRDIAERWARELATVAPEAPKDDEGLKLVADLNEGFLALVVMRIRTDAYSDLYDVYYTAMRGLIDADLRSETPGSMSLASLHTSMRLSLRVIEEWLGPLRQRLMIAYLKLANQLLMLVGQAYADCREEYLERARHLAEVDKRKDGFLAVLSHELRNPLASLVQAVEVLRRADGGPQRAWAQDVMTRQLGLLTRLVDDLLDVARIRHGKIRLQCEVSPVAALIERALDMARPMIAARSHTLDVDLPHESLAVRADPTRIAQAVGNLLNNAAKFTPAGGHISLRVARENDEVVLRVRDSGIGIAADVLPSVFEWFAQVERASNDTDHGLGVGLPLVRSIVELHGGRVAAHSPGPGGGSEFTLWLPPWEQPAEAATPGATDGITASRALRILVVDDNVDAALGLQILLETTGHRVCVVHTGDAALALAPEFAPDVVLLDIGLPGIDGYETARGLRTQPALRQTRLIAVTGYGQDEDRRRSREEGFHAHLLKPVQFEVLQELLEA